jgi:flagellar hook protein FlgE
MVNWCKNRAVKFSCCRFGIFGLALVAGVFVVLTPRPMLAQSATFNANRALVSTGTPAAPPSAIKSRRVPADATASIDVGTGVLVTAYSRHGSFDRVGLRHDQTVDITVQYSTANAGQTITVEPLDGGQIVAPAKNLVVGNDGAIHFKFHAGHQPGVYQIALRNGGQELGLQFWVRDEDHPGNNPRVINPGN